MTEQQEIKKINAEEIGHTEAINEVSSAGFDFKAIFTSNYEKFKKNAKNVIAYPTMIFLLAITLYSFQNVGPLKALITELLFPYVQPKVEEYIRSQVAEQIRSEVKNQVKDQVIEQIKKRKVDGGYPQYFIFSSKQNSKVLLAFYALKDQEVTLNARSIILQGSKDEIVEDSKIYFSVDGTDLNIHLLPAGGQFTGKRIESKLDPLMDLEGQYHQLGISSPIFKPGSKVEVLVEILTVVKGGDPL